FLIRLVELSSTLVGQIQVSPRLAADQDRDAEERGHRGMARRKAVGPNVLGDIRQAQRLGLRDQQPKHAATARKVADQLSKVGIDPRSDEVGEVLALVVEDTDRRKSGAREVPGYLQETLEHVLQLTLGDERARGLGQPAEPLLAKCGPRISGSSH